MIREANITDIVNIVNLEAEVLKESLGLEFYDTEFNHNPFKKYFIFEEYKHLIGFIGTRFYDDIVEVMNFVVSKKYQHRGIGTKLLNHVTLLASSLGANQISLEVRRSNEQAKSFYFKNGFKESYVRVNYYGNEDALLLIKELSK